LQAVTAASFIIDTLLAGLETIAPDAVRDQMMHHDPEWATFNSAYINEKVEFHLQNAFLDEPTEVGDRNALAHRPPARPHASKDMVPDEVWENMPPDPEIVALEAERAQLKDIPERAQLAEILCNQPEDLSPIELLELRIQATELMVALYGKQETAK
jgi:hypothetical protein